MNPPNKITEFYDPYFRERPDSLATKDRRVGKNSRMSKEEWESNTLPHHFLIGLVQCVTRDAAAHRRAITSAGGARGSSQILKLVIEGGEVLGVESFNS